MGAAAFSRLFKTFLSHLSSVVVDAVELSVVTFAELLVALPWWNRAWRVTQVGPAYLCETPKKEGGQGVVEVPLLGMARGGAADTLPFRAGCGLKMIG
ncbi:hypothetical protein ACIBF5_19195 [Micromonospora sp. NPDC050417]|uniref:hypothetical protein n=1 Tax=Micromonospora sp. NPDC050417 TaxID=3364280 RepID=UPI0037A67151